MKKIINRFSGIIIAVAALATACRSEDVALPKASVLLDKYEIVATTMEADFSVAVQANCDWTATVEESAQEWMSVSPAGGFGNRTLSVSVSTNATSSTRQAVVTVGPTGSDGGRTLVIKQPSATGNITVSDIRTLASSNLVGGTTSHTITDDWKLSAVVNTVHTFANLPDSAFGVQDSKSANSGIMVRTAQPLWKRFGTEIQISLKNAVLTKASNGVLEVQPASDDNISETETAQAQITPVSITAEQYASGGFESMYVCLPSVQVTDSHLGKSMEGALNVIDQDFEIYTMYTYENASFYGVPSPTGSGDLSGVMSIVDGETVILPMFESDFSLTGNRFGTAKGIDLPYVFSFVSKGTTDAEGMQYSQMRMSDGSNWANGLSDPPAKQLVEPTDGSGVQMTFWKKTASNNSSNANNGVRYRYSADNLDNTISLQLWGEDPYPYVLVTYPVGEESLSGRLNLYLGLTGSNYAPRNWVMMYSTDNMTWSPAVSIAIPAPEPATKRNIPHYFTAPITLSETLDKGSSLYVKLTISDNIRVGGYDAATEGGEARIFSSMVLQRSVNPATPAPTGSIYSESFDRISGGVDYLLGDKLGNLGVYAGADISAWTADERNGLTGEYVGMRPGYVQIGHADFQEVLPKDMGSCKTGSLITPALSVLTEPTDITVDFKAMAYKTASRMTNAADAAGDLTSLRIEVQGAGTIDGRTSAELTGMSYSEFKDFSVEVSGATSATRIKFTSPSGTFTRWFLDDIAIYAGDASEEPDPAYGDPNTPGSGMHETDPTVID